MSAAVRKAHAPPESICSTVRVQLLVDHYRRGLSASESAALIGGVSKNAVVSKRRRLGLLAVIGSPRDPDPAQKSPRCERVPPLRAFRGPPPLPVSPLPDMDQPPPLGADPKPLAARRFGECAWPLGPAEAEGDHRTLFCAARTMPGKVYCAAHAARAYRPRS